jgi:hypothetical protein
MGLLPSFGGIDAASTVTEVVGLLTAIRDNLETLIEQNRSAASAQRLGRVTDARQAAERRARSIATDIGQALPDSLFHDHETDDTGRITWCPVYALTGEERVHQVKADGGFAVSCHPKPNS